MKLNELNSPEAGQPRKRVGRGIGSGTGKTAGRGHKGQKSRSGVSIKGFEGGQMPIFRRLPKRGFTNHTRVAYATLNLSDIQYIVDSKKVSSSVITKENLIELGLIKKTSLLKILSSGALKSKVTIHADAASVAAKTAIEKAGASLVLSSDS